MGDTLMERENAPLSACADRRDAVGASVASRRGKVEDASVLIVDDEPVTLRLVERHLRSAGFSRVNVISSPEKALELLETACPDLILLDVELPVLNGLDLLVCIRNNAATAHVPIVMLTGHTGDNMKFQALELGANDFLMKPIVAADLLPRVRNLLSLRLHQKWLESTSEWLEVEVKRRTAALVKAQHHVIDCLARAAEFRDTDTGNHVVRVGKYAALIARSLGLGDCYAEMIEQAAKLHDVGKIGIPDRILHKNGQLDPGEYEIMRSHCRLALHVTGDVSESELKFVKQHVHMGARILDVSESPLLKMASRIALTHHEWWDGAGYPLGLKGDEIPHEGRITAVADVFDALSSKRSYKPAFALPRCFAILEEGRGTQFDPAVLDAFLWQRDQVTKIHEQFADERAMSTTA